VESGGKEEPEYRRRGKEKDKKEVRPA